jgi:hypothetical protein
MRSKTNIMNIHNHVSYILSCKNIGKFFLTQYGIDDVFFNVIRAAMIERRKIKFWSTQLRKIKYPLIQEPMEWPIRFFPNVKVPDSTINEELADILTRQNVGDMIVNVHDVCFRTQRVNTVTI